MQRVFHLVGDAAGKSADRFEPLRLDQLHLRGLQLLVRLVKLGKRLLQCFQVLLPLGNVARHDHHLARVAAGVFDHAPLRLNVPDGAVGPQHAILRALAGPGRDGFLKKSFDLLLVVRMNFLK